MHLYKLTSTKAQTDQPEKSIAEQMFYAYIRCTMLCSQCRSLGEAWYLLQQP